MRIVTGFDLETTGLLDPEHRIIEVAAILFDLDSGNKVGQLIQRFNPGRPIDPEAQAVHHITFEQVANHARLEDSSDVTRALAEIARKSTCFVAHNGRDFDMPFVEQEYRRIGLSFPKVPLVDTMLSGTWATYNGKRPSLQELCFACRVDYDPEKAHAAEYDVLKMMECFFFGYKRGFFELPV